MITCQHEWIKQCQIKYRWEKLPEGEHWEDAHYPTPLCLGGTETVKLWSRDHAVHGVLQSEDIDHPCLHSFRTNSDRELLSNFYPEYLDLYSKWRVELSRRGGLVGGRINVESGQWERARACNDHERMQEIRTMNGRRNAENGFFTLGHPNCILTTEAQSAAGKVGGRIAYEKGLGVFDKAKKEKRKQLGTGEYSPENKEKMKTVLHKNGSLTMAYKYTDPDHPELGLKAAPVLVRMQKKRGYPHGPENRVRVL